MWQCGALLCPPPIKIGIFYQLTCIGYSLHAAQRSTLQYAITVTVTVMYNVNRNIIDL